MNYRTEEVTKETLESECSDHYKYFITCKHHLPSLDVGLPFKVETSHVLGQQLEQRITGSFSPQLVAFFFYLSSVECEILQTRFYISKSNLHAICLLYLTIFCTSLFFVRINLEI